MTGAAKSSDDLWNEALSSHRSRQADEIVATALRIVAAEGMSALTMSAVASGAGISRQTLYRYFSDIDSILTAAMKSSEAINAQIVETLSTGGTPVSRLDLFIRMMLESAAAGHPSTMYIAESLPPDARKEVRKHSNQVEAHLVEIVQDGVASGEFSADLEPEVDGAVIYRFIRAGHDLVAEAEAVEPMIRRITVGVHRLVGSCED